MSWFGQCVYPVASFSLFYISLFSLSHSRKWGSFFVPSIAHVNTVLLLSKNGIDRAARLTNDHVKYS